MMFRILLFISLLTIAHAQGSDVPFHPAAEESFLSGIRSYAQKDFRPALQAFALSLSVSPGNHRTTAAMMMMAKTEFALKNYSASLAWCESLETSYPETIYREDIGMTRGMCYYAMGEWHRAANEMLRTFTGARQPLNRTHAEATLEHLLTGYLSEEETDALVHDTIPAAVRNIVLVVRAERFYREGKGEEAKHVLQQFDPAAAEQALQFRVNRLMSRIDKGNIVKIGVLLPLMSSIPGESREKRIVNEVLEGIRLAVTDQEERSVPGQVSFELDVQDSEKDSAVIGRVISSWADDPSVAGIIGPVFSTETMAAARIAQQRSIPIITPTATDEGISAVGPYVFQANSTNGAKGMTMARYAVQVLGARRIAVLASALPSTAVQADSFIAEAARLGAEIVSDKRIPRGETDIRSYVRAIRIDASALRPDYVVTMRGKINTAEISRKLVSLGVRFSTIDSIIASGGSVNFTALFGDSAKRIADSLRLPVKKTAVYVDSLQYPVTTIDLVYCPIANSHDIGVITSQLTYFNIRSILLGSGDWNDANELDLNKRYADGVIFGTDKWIERTETVNRLFSRYAQRYGRSMSDNVLYGFDAMSLLLKQFQNGVVTREQLAVLLGSVTEFPGIRNAVTLSAERVNSSLHILQYKDGVLTKLQTYSLRP